MAKSCAPSNIIMVFFSLSPSNIQMIVYAPINLSKRNFFLSNIHFDSNRIKLLQANQVNQHISHYKIVFKLWSLDSISLKCWLIDKAMVSFIVCVSSSTRFFLSIFFARRVFFSSFAFINIYVNVKRCRPICRQIQSMDFEYRVWVFVLLFISSDGLF